MLSKILLDTTNTIFVHTHIAGVSFWHLQPDMKIEWMINNEAQHRGETPQCDSD